MGTLYVVATPIGNLEDVTLRALRVLGEVDWLLAEDTRHTRRLLDRHGLATSMRSLHAHNEEARIGEVVEALEGGARIALVSDAGTPLVSDPGSRLVAAVVDAGLRVEPLPGPSAVLAALSVAGLASHPFAFLGFAPRKDGARRRWFEAWVGRPETLVLFESPHRIGALLAVASEVLGERRACVARELTKMHEEVTRGTLAELAESFAREVKGEVTVVIEGERAERPEIGVDDLDARARALRAEGHSARDAAALLAAETGVAKRDCYARVLAIDAETGAEPSGSGGA